MLNEDLSGEASLNENVEASLISEASLSSLESQLGYFFKDQSLLVQALTHRSFVNEHDKESLRNNESLEFLGDAVLGFIVSAQIFRHYPDLTEGELSKIKAYLVSAANLIQLAEGVRLGDYLRLSRGEEKTGGRSKRAIMVDAFEAIIGAIYMDSGVDAASIFISRLTEEVLGKLDLKQLICGDFKSTLQEHLHNLGRPEPVYRVVDEIGPDHKKTFVIQVVVRGEVIAEASGGTKKEAQQSAARLALESLDRKIDI